MSEHVPNCECLRDNRFNLVRADPRCCPSQPLVKPAAPFSRARVGAARPPMPERVPEPAIKAKAHVETANQQRKRLGLPYAKPALLKRAAKRHSKARMAKATRKKNRRR